MNKTRRLSAKTLKNCTLTVIKVQVIYMFLVTELYSVCCSICVLWNAAHYKVGR